MANGRQLLEALERRVAALEDGEVDPITMIRAEVQSFSERLGALEGQYEDLKSQNKDIIRRLKQLERRND